MSKPIAEHITVGAFVNIRDERDALRLKVAEQARTIAELRAFIADVAEGARIRAVELAQQAATIERLKAFAERATGLLQGTRLIDSKPWADLLRAGYAVLSKQEPPA